MAYCTPETIGDKLKIIGKILKLINLGVTQKFHRVSQGFTEPKTVQLPCLLRVTRGKIKIGIG